MKKAKPILVLVVKLLVSVGLLGYFLARIHIERFLQTFANAKFSYIAIALLVYLATQVVSAMSKIVATCLLLSNSSSLSNIIPPFCANPR